MRLSVRREHLLIALLILVLWGGTILSGAVGTYTIATGSYASMDLSGRRNPVIAMYLPGTKDLQITVCSDEICLAKTNTLLKTAGTVGKWANLILAPDGFPMIGYYDESALPNPKPMLIDCGNLTCSNITRTVSMDASSSNRGQYLSMALQPNGAPVMAFYDAISDTLNYSYCTTLSCSTVITPSTPLDTVSGRFASMKLASDGKMVISYYDTSLKNLKLLICSTVACSGTITRTTVDEVGDVGRGTALGFGPAGFPLIAYYDNTAKVLKLADCANSTCTSKTITVIDSIGGANVPDDTRLSMVVRANSRPLIAYQVQGVGDATLGDLRLADCEDAGCGTHTIRVLDENGTSGVSPSIAIRIDGTPMVAYSRTVGPTGDPTSAVLLLYDSGNRAPDLAPVPDVLAREGQPVTFTLTAVDSDNKPPQTMSYAMFGQVLAGASLNPATGVFSWTPTAEQHGTYTLIFSVTDDGSPRLTDYETVTITVGPDNAAPQITVASPQTVIEMHTLEFTVNVNDPDVGQTVTLTADNLPAGASFDSGTGAFAWTPTPEQIGRVFVTFTATDDGDPPLSAQITVEIRVHDQLVLNPGFETPDLSGKFPADWIVTRSTGDKRICTDANTGACSFIMTGGKTVAKLKQRLNVSYLDNGDSLTASVAIRRNLVPASVAVLKLKVLYVDGAVEVQRLTIPAGTSAGFEPYSTAPIVISSVVSKVLVQIKYPLRKGSITLDNVEVVAVSALSDPTRGLPLPLPTVPDAWRTR